MSKRLRNTLLILGFELLFAALLFMWAVYDLFQERYMSTAFYTVLCCFQLWLVHKGAQKWL